MDEEAAAMMSSGPRPPVPSPGAGGRLTLVEELPSVKIVSEPPSPNLEDAPSERVGVERRLPQLEWETKILWFQAIVAKQTLKKHMKHICHLDPTMRAMCELIVESRSSEEEARSPTQKPTGPSPQVGLPVPLEMIIS